MGKFKFDGYFFRLILFRIIYFFRRQITTDYRGEFGYELIAVLPFAYWLHKHGKLKQTISAKDTKSLYYFSDNHQEAHDTRDYVLPEKFPMHSIHVRQLYSILWTPPPLKDHYKNSEIVFDKPILVICNKYSSEWGHPPISYFDKDCLSQLFDMLCSKYQVIYFRPEPNEIVNDNSDLYSLNEHDWIRDNHSNVLLIQDLLKKYPKYSFNELQLKCFANSDSFISVQGGYAILASYFKGQTLIYGSKTGPSVAPEITRNLITLWYRKFSGATIRYSSTYDSLLESVRKHYI